MRSRRAYSFTRFPRFAKSHQRGLTIHSTGHFAACRVWPSFHSGPNPTHRKVPVSSNVRPRKQYGAYDDGDSRNMKTREEIIERLAKHRQRATYGALAGLIDRHAIGVMNGLSKDKRNSWIVAKNNGLPTGYNTEEIDSRLASSSNVIDSSDELAAWLKNNQ